MPDPEEHASSPPTARLAREVGQREQRMLSARRRPQRSVWLLFGTFGIVGWSIVVPTLAGAALGWWLDDRYPAKHSWTLTLLVVGLTLGALNAWRWIERERQDLEREQNDQHPPPEAPHERK